MNDTSEKSGKPSRPNPWLGGLGMAFCSGGGASLGMGLIRHIQAPPGQTFYAPMIIGGALIVIGFFIVRSLRPKRG